MINALKFRAKPPEKVTVNGAEYTLITDFANCLTTLEMLADESISEHKRAEVLIENMYLDPLPPFCQEAINAAMEYLAYNHEKPSRVKSPKLLDLEFDWKRLCNAFYVHRNIDLNKDSLTYWQFIAHLRELPQCELTRFIYLRSQSARGKLTREERQEIERIGRENIFFSEKADTADFEDFLLA